MQAVSIKPAAGACSLGQDASLKIGNRFLFPFRPMRMAERIEFLTTLFSVKRTKARRQVGRHARRGVSKPFSGELASPQKLRAAQMKRAGRWVPPAQVLI
jgi:hypothetical protein